jgi:hypothetical protein
MDMNAKTSHNTCMNAAIISTKIAKDIDWESAFC